MDNAVLDTSNPAVHTKEIELRLYIAPAWLADPMEGIREQLDRMVLRYVDQLDGVLLSYEDLRLKMSALGQPLGRIRDDLPEIHLRVIFTATYFAPKAGDRMDCMVSRIGTDHIALLVMGVFNGTVALPPDWDPAKPKVEPDETREFIVRSVRHVNGILSMQGDLEGVSPPHPRRERQVRRAGRVPLPRAAAAADSGRQSGRGRPLQQRPLRRRRCLLRRQWPRPPPPLLPIRRLTGMARVPASGRRRQRRRRRSGNERRRRPHEGPRERKREEEAPLGRDGRPKGSVSAVLMCLSSTVQ